MEEGINTKLNWCKNELEATQIYKEFCTKMFCLQIWSVYFSIVVYYKYSVSYCGAQKDVLEVVEKSFWIELTVGIG
jgi:hypothetical protein